MSTRRMPAEKRKQQIVQVALKTVDRYGIRGATMGRIARGAGISQAALYVHFRSRQEILAAVLDVIYEEIARIQELARNEDPIKGLREATGTYCNFVGGRRTAGHAHLLLEFVAGSRDRWLREALKQKQLTAMAQLAGIIEEGKQGGGIPQEVSSEELAWMLTGWSWALDVAQLMDLRGSWHPTVSASLLDAILGSVQGPRLVGENVTAGPAMREHVSSGE